MIEMNPRMQRERRTVEHMIALYCRGHHQTKDRLCDECQALGEYARQRLDRCPFQENKTTCAQCPIHCYKPEMRERVRTVMRYAGPRMIHRHPVLAIRHLLDSRRQAPAFPPAPNARRRSENLGGE